MQESRSLQQGSKGTVRIRTADCMLCSNVCGQHHEMPRRIVGLVRYCSPSLRTPSWPGDIIRRVLEGVAPAVDDFPLGSAR